MAFDWNKYLTLAKELATAADEAKMRSAISRSYYCAFNLARNYIVKVDPAYKYTNHADLWNEFIGIAGKAHVQTYGDRIRKSRNKADYDENINKLQAEVATTLLNVHCLLSLLK